MPKGQYKRQPKPPVIPAELPAKVRLTRRFGFIAKFGAVYDKFEGTIIDDPEEIAMLTGRGAPIEPV